MQILDAETTPDLLARLGRLRPDTHAQWGKMNAHQMICHLNDSFTLAMGARKASERITFFSRTLVRWVALHTQLPWPQGVPTRAEVDQVGGGGTPPTEFARDAAALASTIQRFSEGPQSYRFGRHPVFGELTEREWMRWGYRHADHHLRQFGL